LGSVRGSSYSAACISRYDYLAANPSCSTTYNDRTWPPRTCSGTHQHGHLRRRIRVVCNPLLIHDDHRLHQLQVTQACCLALCIGPGLEFIRNSHRPHVVAPALGLRRSPRPTTATRPRLPWRLASRTTCGPRRRSLACSIREGLESLPQSLNGRGSCTEERHSRWPNAPRFIPRCREPTSTTITIGALRATTSRPKTGSQVLAATRSAIIAPGWTDFIGRPFTPLPVGLVYDGAGHVVLDPDTAV
jgi:hypothetical protein